MKKIKLEHQELPEKLLIKHNNVGSLLVENASANPDGIYIKFPGKVDENCSYEQLLDNSLCIASYFKELGLNKGDKISIIFNNSPEFILLYFAGLISGIVIVPINPDLSKDEISYIINDSKSKAVFFDSNFDSKLSSFDSERNRFLIKKSISAPNFNVESFSSKKISITSVEKLINSDLAVIIYTSGTTGKPKGVVLSHLNLLSDSFSISSWFKFNSSTVTLCILPLHHNNGQITTLLAPLYKGGSTIIVKGKSALLPFWDLINKYNVTWTSVMASILSILLGMKKERKDNTLKGILCGGQILSPNLQKSFEERFNVPIFEGYGLTETTSFSCINNYPKNLRVPQSIGKPLPSNIMKIADENGNECKPMMEGEICIKGYNVAVEYFNLKNNNLKSFKNGWFHSGDFGYVDENGYFFFKSRKDHLIIKGGENIYPAELENILYLHPQIIECAVIGIPDRFLGQEIAAFIKLEDGIDLEQDEILSFCKNKISAYKQPKKIFLLHEINGLSDIPKGPTKKVLYRKLEKFYKQNLRSND